MVERAELRRLAEAIKEQGPAWYRPGLLFDLLGAAVLDTEQCEMDAAYIAAASPDAVLGLLDEIERLRDESKQALVIVGNIGRELGQTQYERDQLRAEVERLKHIRAGECDVGLCRSFEGEREEIRAVAVRLKGYLENIQGNTRQDVVRWDCETALADPEVEKL